MQNVKLCIEEFFKVQGYEEVYETTGEEFLNSILTHLRERFQCAYGRRKEFPHEIGVFLGYPMEDVIGFIENNDKNCLCTGYWKVYSNPERAKNLFRYYDEARESAIYEILNEKNFMKLPYKYRNNERK